MKNLQPKIFLIILAVLGAIASYYLHSENKDKVLHARKQNIENTHARAVNKFSGSIDKMAGLVAGMKGFLLDSDSIPDQKQFHNFVKRQLDDIKSQDSIVVSYIDKSHVFRQVFTRNELDPAGLVGKQVSSLRSLEKIKMLDGLMEKDELILFPPINLKEGWLGIPINFRVFKDNKLYGYVAPILSFESIISSIYDEGVSEEFVFKFTTERGNNFDRTRIYNGTKVYTTKKDIEFYKNFNVEENKFISTTKEYYGFKITIGTAYKNELPAVSNYSLILLFGYLFFLTTLIIITWQWEKNRKTSFELKRLNTTKDLLFSIVGHDIKQPLNSIEGLIYLIKTNTLEGKDLNDILDQLESAVGNTTILLDNLLRWGSSQTGNIKFSPKLLSTKSVIDKSINLLQEAVKQKEITLDIHIFAENIYADEDMLDSILRNLLSNAIKYTFKKGTIQIDIQETAENTEVKISDNGIGMDKELVSMLFEFSSISSSEGTQGEKGTGLGLILCKDFVSIHKGKITVHSEIDKGSTFTLVFPKMT